jgi:succinyl-diaminopimelate desuccinylase
MGGVPCAVIGPGEPAQCHRTDEFCSVERIEAATLLYADLIGRYCQ